MKKLIITLLLFTAIVGCTSNDQDIYTCVAIDKSGEQERVFMKNSSNSFNVISFTTDNGESFKANSQYTLKFNEIVK